MLSINTIGLMKHRLRPEVNLAGKTVGSRLAPIFAQICQREIDDSNPLTSWILGSSKEVLEAAVGLEPTNQGFADLSLSHLGTPPSRVDIISKKILVRKASQLIPSALRTDLHCLGQS